MRFFENIVEGFETITHQGLNLGGHGIVEVSGQRRRLFGELGRQEVEDGAVGFPLG